MRESGNKILLTLITASIITLSVTTWSIIMEDYRMIFPTIIAITLILTIFTLAVLLKKHSKKNIQHEKLNQPNAIWIIVIIIFIFYASHAFLPTKIIDIPFATVQGGVIAAMMYLTKIIVTLTIGFGAIMFISKRKDKKNMLLNKRYDNEKIK